VALGASRRESVEGLLGWPGEAEERLCLGLADEEVTHAGQYGLEERAGLRRRPERRAIVDVEGHRGRLGQRALDQRAGCFTERRRDPGEVDQPRAPDRLPVHLSSRQPGERGIASVIRTNRARRDPILEEIDADARPFRRRTCRSRRRDRSTRAGCAPTDSPEARDPPVRRPRRAQAAATLASAR
jgi:hypothetical protein